MPRVCLMNLKGACRQGLSYKNYVCLRRRYRVGSCFFLYWSGSAARVSQYYDESATSAFFGARIKQFQEEIKDWMQRHKNRYSHPGITHL